MSDLWDGLDALPEESPDPEDLPVSYGQERFWFLQELAGDAALFNVGLHFRVRGRLEPALLRDALASLTTRHESLRTGIRARGGEPRRRVVPDVDVPLEVITLERAEELDAVRRDTFERPFDLGEPPLWRARLCLAPGEEAHLVLAISHLVSDGASLALIASELLQAYDALAWGTAPEWEAAVPYGDFVAWQRGPDGAERLEAQLAYWRRQLSPPPPPVTIARDRRDPAGRGPTRRTERRLSEALEGALGALAREAKASPFMVVMAAWQVLLARRSGERDVAVGTPVSGRPGARFQRSVGLFINTVTIRSRVEMRRSFLDHVARVKASSLEALRHQDAPFAQVVGALDLDRRVDATPVFQTLLVYNETPPGAARGGGLELELEGRHQGRAVFDVELQFSAGDGLEARLVYDAHAYEAATVDAILDAYVALLEALVAAPRAPLAQLDLLGPGEREALVSLGRGPSHEGPLASVLERLAARADAPARALERADGTTWSYAELWRASGAVAARLEAAGVRPGDRVAIGAERGPWTVAAMIGVWRAGAAYVPVDPALPARRIALMLGDSGARLTLVDDEADRGWGPQLALGGDVPARDPFEGRLFPGDEAYLIYTSGSTGTPKGVSVPHRAVTNFLWSMASEPGLSERDVLLAVTTFSFDISVLELFLPLLVGGSVLLASRAEAGDPERLVALLERATVMQATPATWTMLMGAGWRGGVRAFTGGEALPARLGARLAEICPEVWNLYGPTETTIWSSRWKVDGPPIRVGVPIHETTLRVLDRDGQLVPDGTIGELSIGGRGVANGYHGRPALTAERFVPDPFGAPGGRLYRTGDLARWVDGEVECLGRTDFQVKLRGFRIELGEIEAALESMPGVLRAVAWLHTSSTGAEQLVAHYEGEPVDADEARRVLGERLPEYMVPTFVEHLAELPLNTSGKVDRARLPAPIGATGQAGDVEPPQGPLENAIASAWRDALGVDVVDRRSDFFELGGDSIRLLPVAAALREEGHPVELADFFAHRRLHQLASALAARETDGGGVSVGPFELVDADADAFGPSIEAAYPLTRLQAAMVAHAARGATMKYHEVVAYRVDGGVDPSALEAAMATLVERHELLRTSFRLGGGPEPVQRVHREATVRVEARDARGWVPSEVDARVQALLAAEARRPFDLAAAPLFRVSVHHLPGETALVVFSFHHAILDGWSVATLLAELGALLRGQALPPPPRGRYRDYVRVERDAERDAEVREAWRRELEGFEPMESLPTEPDAAGATPETRELDLSPDLLEALEGAAERAGTTLPVALASAHAAVMAAYTGRRDVAIGWVTHGRPPTPDAERQLGLFLNTQPLRVDVRGDWAGLLDATGRGRDRLQRLRYYPLSAVSREVGGRPFESIFVVGDFHVLRGLEGADLAAVERHSLHETEIPLEVFFVRRPEGAALRLIFAPAVADAARDGMVVAHERALRALARGGAVRLAELLAPEQTSALARRNATQRGWRLPPTLMDAFEAQVDRDPTAVALSSEEGALSYAELDARANAVANALRERGVGLETRVAVCVERSLERLVAVYGVLKADAAYVPVEVDLPAERARAILEDAGCQLVLTAGDASPGGLEGARVEDVRRLAEGERRERPVRRALPQNTAYVIFTSGSTGRPKGAANAHGAVMNRLTWMQEALPLDARDVALHKTPFGFDVSVWELFWPLQVGAQLRVAPPKAHREPRRLWRVIEEAGVTISHFVPSMLGPFLDATPDAPSGLRRVVCSGEALGAELRAELHRRLPGAELHNLYGPTEAAIDVTWWPCPADDTRRPVPIGRPIANTTTHVLDEELERLPDRVAGQLHLGGVQVGLGYVGRPALTAARFVCDPFGHGERMYATGDRCRWGEDGALDYLGRVDFQVKINGLRIELGEIEAVLEQHPSVSQAVAWTHPAPSGGLRLVAYHVGEAVEAEALREHLRGQLPAYMVPAELMHLPALPLTGSGKVNRAALPAPGRSTRAYEPPRGENEALLASLWAQVLGLERVGRDDDFIALGGDSISMLPVLGGLEERGLRLDVEDLLADPVLHRVAARLTAHEGSGSAYAPWSLVTDEDRQRLEGEAVDAFPMTQIAQGMVFHQVESPGSASYHDVVSLLVRGAPSTERLVDAVHQIVERHPALRASFRVAGFSRALTVIHRRCDVDVRVVDARDWGEAVEAYVARACAEETSRPFELEAAPLLRVIVHELAGDRKHVMLSFHHAVMDGWSLSLVIAELSAAWTGRALPRPPKDVLGLHVAREQEALADADTDRFWARRPEAPPPSRLPLDGEETLSRSLVPLDDATAAALHALAERLGVSVKNVFLACHLVVQSMLGGVARVTTGLTTHTRPHEGGDEAVGMFLNSLPFTVDVEGTWAELIRRVHDLERAHYRHRLLPYPEILRRGHSRPYDSAFNFVSFRAYRTALEGAGFEVERLEMHERGELPLSFHVRLDGTTRALAAELHSFNLAEPLLTRMRGMYARALTSAAEATDATIDAEALLGEAERADVTRRYATAGEGDWARGHDLTAARALTLGDMFDEAARRHPSLEAVIAADRNLTYAELAAEVDALAARLVDRGVGPGDRVSVVVGRGAWSIAAILGVTKAGAAYVPIDETEAPDRAAWMCEGCAAHLVATDSGVELDPDAKGSSRRVPSRPDQLAYVIFTSGTTGRPKGVEIEHRAIANTVLWAREALKLGPGVRSGHVAPLSFDAGNRHVYDALTSGATLVMAPTEVRTDADRVVEWLTEHRVEVFNAAPVILRFVYPRLAELDSLRVWTTGGEPLALPRGARLPFQLFFEYGPTEASVATSCEVVAPDTQLDEALSIGRPVPGASSYVLDESLRAAPREVTAQLCLGGAGVGRGYTGKPALTAERFRPDPFADEPGARMYLTGDLARWRPDGRLQFEGRRDRQVKIRGFRIEVDEVEAVLGSVPGVDASAVLVEGAGSAKRLVAYAAPRSRWTPTTLRAALAERLPPYMVPAKLVIADELPTKQNGKVDTAALRAAPPTPDDAPPPEGPTEVALAALWSRLLGVERVGRTDDFFALGGHSLLVTRLVAELQREHGKRIAVADVFATPQLDALASHLDAIASGAGAPSTVTSLTRGGEGPALHLLHAADGDPAVYRELAEAFAGDFSVVGLRSPRLFEAGAAEVPIEELVRAHADAVETHQPEGPLAIGGWSLGAIFAHAVAAELVRRGRTIEMLLLVDPTVLRGPAPTPDDVLREVLARGGAEVDDALRGEAELWAAHLQAAHAYRPSPLDVPALAFFCGERPEADATWRALAPRLEVVPVDAGHYDVLERRHADALIAQVRRWLGRG
ncbi:MAG: amino acid adenylation domain-containing protein [Myxococcota bacterium]|nr:amino acid adenylation domain-containing protein [Myxococcota bacterium]